MTAKNDPKTLNPRCAIEQPLGSHFPLYSLLCFGRETRGQRLTRKPSYNIYYTMAIETKVRKIGNSLGIVLPKEALRQLNVEEGAIIHLTGDAEGAMRLTPNRPGFKEKMAIAEEGMRRYRNALRELAK